MSTEDRMKMVPSCRYEALHGSAHMCHAHATEEFLNFNASQSRNSTNVKEGPCKRINPNRARLLDVA